MKYQNVTNDVTLLLSSTDSSCTLTIKISTTFTNFIMKYLVMCRVYTDAGGIK